MVEEGAVLRVRIENLDELIFTLDTEEACIMGKLSAGNEGSCCVWRWGENGGGGMMSVACNIRN